MSGEAVDRAMAVVETVGPRGCTATSSRTGKPCGGIAVKRPDGRSTGRCRSHGGTMIANTRPGPSHPSFRHGRRSVLAKRLKQLGMGAEPSPDLLGLGPDIELVDVLVDRAAAALAEGVKANLNALRIEGREDRLLALAETRQRMTVAARKQIANEAKRVTNAELEAAIHAVMTAMDMAIDDPDIRVSATRPIRELLGIEDPADTLPEGVEPDPLQFDTPG